MSKPMEEIVAAKFSRIAEQREEILEAFVAKYGFSDPGEAIQIEQRMPDGGTRWFVRKITKSEAAEISDVVACCGRCKEPVSGIITGRAIPSKPRWSAVADAMTVGQCYKVATYNEAVGLRSALNKRGKKCRFEQLEPKRQGAVFVHCIKTVGEK